MERPEMSAEEEARWAALGQHVGELRGVRRLGQELLAKRSGVSVATIRAIEKYRRDRRFTPRTLQKLSEGFGLAADYLGNYLENPARHEGRAAPTGPPPRSIVEEVVLRLDGMIVDRLKEIVVPLLIDVKKEVRSLADVLHPTGPGVEIYPEHPGDAEEASE